MIYRLIKPTLLVTLGLFISSFVITHSEPLTMSCQTISSQQQQSFDPSQPLRVMSWNLFKNRRGNADELLLQHATAHDLSLLQEATLDKQVTAVFDRLSWYFAQGYSTDHYQSGVLTASKIPALEHCQFLTIEPWLRTPKAVSISRYGVKSLPDLLVINIHGVNFEWSLKHYQQQLNMIANAIAEHKGAVVLAGDFNTWRKHRAKSLDQLAKSHDLTAIGFTPDHRVSFLGNHLDHIYIRGFEVNSSQTIKVNSSDHNPLFAELIWAKL